MSEKVGRMSRLRLALRFSFRGNAIGTAGAVVLVLLHFSSQLFMDIVQDAPQKLL